MPRAIKPFQERPKSIVKTLLYPYTFYDMTIHVKRLAGEPISVNIYIQVDRIRGKGFIIDSIPEMEDAEGEPMKPLFSDEKSEKIARRTALYFIMKKFRIGLAPNIQINKKIDAYKVFWLIRDTSGLYIVDSVTGDLEEISST